MCERKLIAAPKLLHNLEHIQTVTLAHTGLNNASLPWLSV